jgi:hypothetical protein
MADAAAEGPIQKGVSLTKDIFSLLRDGALFVGFVLLLVFPKFVNQALSAAGVVEINNGLVKWQSQLGATTDQLQTANDTIAGLQTQLQKLNETTAAAKAASPVQQEAIDSARVEAKQETASANQVQQSLQATIQTNKLLLAPTSVILSKAAPAQAYCYQEQDNAKPAAQRYAVLCHTTKANCDTARGPNPKTIQSLCTLVDLRSATWSPRSGGYLGSWYQFGPTPFPAPFPQTP